MSLLPIDNEDIFYDGPSKAYLEQAMKDIDPDTLQLMLWASNGVPLELGILLMGLGFKGDFNLLGLRVEEALSMDTPTLQRLINDKMGIVDQQNAKREQSVKESNSTFLQNAKNMNRFQL